MPTPSDRTEQAVRVIQHHLDEASRRRGGALVEARDLDADERQALARDLATVLGPGERQPLDLDPPGGTDAEGRRPPISA
jgi:hypothetical protein